MSAREPFSDLRNAASRDPLWEVQQIALGSADEVRAINLAEWSVFNSLLAPAGSVIDFDSRAQVTDTERIDVRRLDSVFSTLPKVPTMLKLDVQGYEREALLGATQSLPGSWASSSRRPFRRSIKDSRRPSD